VTPPAADLCETVTINYDDNKYLSKTALRDIEELRAKDPEGFEHVYNGMCRQVVEGAVYRAELLKADKDGRICKVPYDTTKPVHTFWDLGFADMTCVWFAQTVGFEFRLIDYIEGSQLALHDYLKRIQEKPYAFGTDYLPHDARAHQLGSGRSVEEQMRAFGRRVEVVPRLSVEDGIAAARAIFRSLLLRQRQVLRRNPGAKTLPLREGTRSWRR
jgi:phage terminase large subunit